MREETGTPRLVLEPGAALVGERGASGSVIVAVAVGVGEGLAMASSLLLRFSKEERGELERFI